MIAGALGLAGRYLVFHRGKTAIMTVCLTVIFFLPLSTRLLIDYFQRKMGQRASETPLVVGRRGGEYGLVLSTLYFSTDPPAEITQGDADKLRETDLATVIPFYARHTARGYNVIGTSYEYFELRGLQSAVGTLPALLGDAVLGADVAAELGLNAGDKLLTDQRNLYNLAGAYPLKLNVCGVLRRAGTADDRAVFVDVKTTWIIDGIGHGHEDAKEVEQGRVLERDSERVTLAPSVTLYNEITPANINSFHFMGAPGDYPLTAIIVVPRDHKSRAILLGRYQNDERLQMLQPTQVITGLMSLVFRIEKVFAAYFGLVVASMALSLSLVVALSLRLRRRELQTLFRLGCSRLTVLRMLATEIALVMVMAGVFACLLSYVLIDWVARAKLV